MNAPIAEGGTERGAVGEGHRLAGVVGVEAVPGPAAAAGPAVTADRAPVQDDEVAGGQAGHALADPLHDPGRLVAEQERVVVVDAALAIVQVGVADATGLHLHHGLAGARVRNENRLDRHRSALAQRDHATYRLRHRRCSLLWTVLWN